MEWRRPGYSDRRGTFVEDAGGVADGDANNHQQGTGDNFYKQAQLLPENFIAAAKEIGQEKGVNVRFQPDYDHSYYTMATFSDDHIEHAAKYLLA